MARLAVAMLALGVLTAPVAVADPILTIDAPGAYAPGVPFDLTVSLTGAESLALYNVELVLSAAGGTAGVDFLFAAAAEPAGEYVFTGEANDGFAFNILGSAKHRITLSDLLTTGSVNTVAGVNDLLAEVTVLTTATMVDDISIAVLADSLELDLPGAGGPIEGFDTLSAALPAPSIPIPEPGGGVLLALAAGAALRKRRAKRHIRR